MLHITYWLASTSEGPPTEFLKEGDSSPMWARDSRSLFFVPSGQLFEQRLDGSAAMHHSHLVQGKPPWQWQISRDGTFFIALQSESKPDAPAAESDTTFVDEGSNGQQRGTWDNVFRYDLKSETLTRVTDREGSIDDADSRPMAEALSSPRGRTTAATRGGKQSCSSSMSRLEKRGS